MWVYAIQAGEDGPVKIGMTVDPPQRIKTLQTANAQPLRPLGLWQGTGADERALHEAFAADRLHGEWFTPNPDLVALAEWLDGGSCEWHAEGRCLAGEPGTCPGCGVEFAA